MPPRKAIFKSGNAGNSKKPTVAATTTDEEKPLFPPGSKYPLNLLHERCQKNEWEKPTVDTRRHDSGWSFVVTLRRLDKKTSQIETVKFEPYPPYIVPSPKEALHWGAVYALYRFCNALQLNRVLPPGPRDYWNELAAEHKASPEHQKWMYDADPFGARKEVDARQARASQKTKVDRDASNSRSPAPGEFVHAPEVQMARDLRDVVEAAIKRTFALYPDVDGSTPSLGSLGDPETLVQQLEHLGFKGTQAKSAVDFLLHPSPLSLSLLAFLEPLEAAIEFLVLHIPECDLPQHFLPSANSSAAFVTSLHSGTENLRKRWIEDKAAKEAGWPEHVVRECTADERFVKSWDLLVWALGRRLIGESWTDPPTLETGRGSLVLAIDSDEAAALGAYHDGPSKLVMPLFSAPMKLHFEVTHSTRYPHPPMYLTSSSVPAYIRLHLLASLLRALETPDFVQAGEGLCMAVMRVLEDEWANIESNGPPNISVVLQHLVPQPLSHTSDENAFFESHTSFVPKTQMTSSARRVDSRSDDQVKEELENLYRSEKYAAMLAVRNRLPAFSLKTEFLERLKTNRVVVVVGDTGCGKTTQLPQFILDSLVQGSQGAKASILVTQPRRISAISVAARVATERMEDGSVGYVIRGESRQSARTKLLFCTTGVVLRRLGSGDGLRDVTHVIVDEVHERSVDGDLLLLELKELLTRHPTLKVVLMSATINHETFVKYFNGAPLITIPGRTYPVKDLYLEGIIPLIDYQVPAARSNTRNVQERKAAKAELLSQGFSYRTVTTIQAIVSSDRIDCQLIAAVVTHIITSASERGGILIFLPGVQDIRQCIQTLHDTSTAGQADIFPLHANLSNEEQSRVFEPTSRWKIVVATNVAETSITVDGITHVIDSGKVKETQYDLKTGVSRLVETWVTQAAAKQRRGRAGRTQPGTCWKLYTQGQEAKMIQFPVPEILRVPLESVSLRVKAMREDEDVKPFLCRAIDPPEMLAIDKASAVLEELGAIDANGRLTPLGRHMSMLPVDLRLGKMLLLGAIFQCLEPTLTIAACLSSKPLFTSPIDKRDEANKARARFSTGNSDLLTDMHAYEECASLRAQGKANTLKTFCEENFISPSTLREITSLRYDLFEELVSLALVPPDSTPSTPALNIHSTCIPLLKSIILAGLWPRVARVHLPTSAIKFDKVQAGTIRRENTAREWKLFDVSAAGGGRVFLHPGSVCFGETAWKSAFVTYFGKFETSKVFLKDATEVPLYALLLFGGPVSVNHVAGGLTVGNAQSRVKLKASPRIGILANQLRRLLDLQLERCMEDGGMLNVGKDNPVVGAILALLNGDGLSCPQL